MKLKPSNRKTLEFGNQKIIVGSSENMEEIPDQTIDVIITSPPYNVGKNYDKNGEYTDKLPLNKYLEFLYNVFKECYRVLKPDGVFFLNISDSAKDQGKSEKVVQKAVEAGFKRIQTIIWVKSIFGKGHYTPSGKNRRLNNVWEYVFMLAKTKKYRLNPKAIGIPYSDKSNIGRYSEIDKRDPGDVWFIPYEITTGAKIKKGHEAPFPIGLPYQCIKLVPNTKTVLDPFAGTGSTLAAANKLNITGIGYERFPNPEIIRKRILETPFKPPKTPLLPQMEKYIEILEKLLTNTIKRLPEKEKQAIINSLTKKEKQNLEWIIKDLEISPEWKKQLNI